MKVTRRESLGFAAALGLGAASSPASAHAETDGEKRIHEDFGWLAKYRDDNQKLSNSGIAPSIIFMGDSITEGWQRQRPDFFRLPRVNRGISGQTTSQMLLRMMPDVVALSPRAVHIMAGTNDIAGNTGPMTRKQTTDNLEAMAVLAQNAGIKVVFGSVLPADRFRWSPDVSPAQKIVELNAWIRGYAEGSGADWIDYHERLVNDVGGMREGTARDGVHPTDAGYAIMEQTATPVLGRYDMALAE